MTIPNKLTTRHRSGFVGEFSHTGPRRVPAAYLAGDSAENMPGRVYQYVDREAGLVSAGCADPTDFAGLGGPHKPQYHVPWEKGDTVALVTMGEMFVEIFESNSVAPTIGGKVYYDKTDGKLYTDAEGGRIQLPTAQIVRNEPAPAQAPGGHLATIAITGPVPA